MDVEFSRRLQTSALLYERGIHILQSRKMVSIMMITNKLSPKMSIDCNVSLADPELSLCQPRSNMASEIGAISWQEITVMYEIVRLQAGSPGNRYHSRLTFHAAIPTLTAVSCRSLIPKLEKQQKQPGGWHAVQNPRTKHSRSYQHQKASPKSPLGPLKNSSTREPSLDNKKIQPTPPHLQDSLTSFPFRPPHPNPSHKTRYKPPHFPNYCPGPTSPAQNH